MDGESHSSLWSRLSEIFSGKSEDHLAQAIKDASKGGDLDAADGSMLLSILSLDDIQVQDIMIPRTDIDCLNCGTKIIEAAKAIGETGHSRLPVFAETKDNIVGVVYAKDLLGSLAHPEGHDEPVERIMRKPFFIPETKIAKELLQEFKARKNHMAIVIDEYGGTSGLITIEDLLEVIVGDIEDEHDAPKEEEIREIGPGKYELSGRAFLEDLEELGIGLTSDDVDTIGGYLSLEAGHLPQTGEEFDLADWHFSIIEADVKQIHKVLAEKIPTTPVGE